MVEIVLAEHAIGVSRVLLPVALPLLTVLVLSRFVSRAQGSFQCNLSVFLYFV